MKKHKKKAHRYTKDRAVLSDTLPYETPLTFSNRYFYRFLAENSIQLVDEKPKSQFIQFNGKGDKPLETVIRTLFHTSAGQSIQEIRFDHIVAFKASIDDLLIHSGWNFFSFELGQFPVLRIRNKKKFLLLLATVDSLKSEGKIIAASSKRKYTHQPDGVSVLKVARALFQQHCQVYIDFEKHMIKCSISHVLYSSFKFYSISRENCINFKELLRKKPFTYRISHKEAEFRELAIPHPKTQIEVASFYEEYKELILYYCSLSPFSIRKPDSIAKYIFFNDKLYAKNRGDNMDEIEISGREYESLKTFFTYRKYPNIHRFYEDYRYHRAEKKYNFLFKFDISKCFDSIYTHSIAWAIYQKNVVKERLSGSDKTFAGKFDNLMQNANYGETNGILIGPEFSRLFSEIILQSIDAEVESSLRIEAKLLFKRDYEVYRYVDDYFVFFNDADTRDKIFTRFKLSLKNYKMSVSEIKNIEYTKPLITELTIAKDKIVKLFDEELRFNIKPIENSEFADLDFRCNSKNLITKFKIIIAESKVTYRDIMNFTLAVINKRIERCIEKFDSYYTHLSKYEFKSKTAPEIYPFGKNDVTRKIKHENRFTNYLIELLDFTFFIYAVDPRVTFTIKLCRIISKLIATYTEKIRFFTGISSEEADRAEPIFIPLTPKFLDENKGNMFKKISDEIRLILEKNKVKQYAQIESLYLLIAIQQLGKEFSLSLDQLIKYFQLKRDDQENLFFDFTPNYFVITVLLFYIRNAKAHSEIAELIKSCILEKIKNVEGAKARDTECIMLLFDVLVCPYLDSKFKRKALNAFGITNTVEQNYLINFKRRQKYWFTKWDKFNFIDEIEAKIAHEPY